MVAPWLAIDIETQAGRPDDAEEWARRHWSPDSRWKPETIGQRYIEAVEKKREKLALLDSAGIAVVAINSPSHGVGLLHCLGSAPTEKTDFGVVSGWDNERAMLLGLRELLVALCSDQTSLVGHNIRGFDLPRLRLAFLRNGLQLPPQLGLPVFDTMREFARSFSVERDDLVSLSEVLTKLGIKNHKELVAGERVGELIKAGQIETVLRYAALDVLAESEVFARLTGTSQHLQ